MNMTHLAVAGGTGVVGRHVVGALTQAGHDVTVIARSAGVDLLTGKGLTEALDGRVPDFPRVCRVCTGKRKFRGPGGIDDR
jgi:nucleoside-diphosphate-sugar epimerase